MDHTRCTRTIVAFLILALFVAVVGQDLLAEEKVVYHGNAKSKVFHKSGCQYYDCKNCTKKFSSKEEAIKAGYRPCKKCKP